VLGSAFSPALTQLFASHEEAVFDYLAFRRDMEGLAAERAARAGSDTDLKVIDTIFSKMEAAHQKRDPADEADLDAAVPPGDHRGQPQRHHAAHDAVDVRAAAPGRVLQPPGHVPEPDDPRPAAGPAPGDQRRHPGARPRAARAAVEAHLSFVEQAFHDQSCAPGTRRLPGSALPTNRNAETERIRGPGGPASA
jgi:GntR family transcriptional repressor for pyruvate dehydrogenase complex